MNVEISVKAEELFRVGQVSITNTMLTTWVVMALLIVGSYLGTRNLQLVPGRFQSMLEGIVEALYGLVEGSTGRYARAAFPLIGTLFIFIVAANWTGLLPGFTPTGLGPGLFLWGEHEHRVVQIMLGAWTIPI